MSSSDTNIRNIWAPIRLGAGVFVHMKSRYQVKGIKVQVVSEVKEILYFPEEDTLGVIFAFKNTRYSSTEKKDAGTDVSFSPHQRNSNYLVTSALLDIFYNKNVNVVSLNHIASSKAGKDRRTILSPSLDDSSESKSSESSDKDTPKFSDEPYRFISYINKDGRIYELDGSKENPSPIGRAVDSQGEEMVWTEWLVAYLEKKIKDSELEFSSAVITEAPNYREKLSQRRKEIKALRTQLEPYIPSAGRGIFDNIQRLENEAQEYEEILFPLQVQSDEPETGESSSSGVFTGGSGESALITETATEFQATSKDTIIIVDEDPILPAQGESGPTTETETGFQAASQDTDVLVQGEELKEPRSGSGSTASIKLEPISEVDEVPEEELEPFGEEGDAHEVKLEPFSEDEGDENPERTGFEFFSENEFEEQEDTNSESAESTGSEGDHLTVEQGRSSVKRKHNDDSDDLGTSPKRKI